MTDFLKNLSFKSRIWIACTLLVTAAIVVNGYMNYRIASQIVERNAIQYNIDAIRKSSQIFDEKLKKMLAVVTSLMITEELVTRSGQPMKLTGNNCPSIYL
ncbi:hypothetical protein GC093_04285 [Paenibacillus sp. LMG 31456]|uniref:Uncharacterized protein n=1 Tax=Paenibacillus foliorum TaxID=2654974 RepID=A0A972JXG9_9BACL|nr:hypothetical protein [Paenibacillus foliorum]NOU92454.1 hypothetical protein [Paenibacillus foliorum]